MQPEIGQNTATATATPVTTTHCFSDIGADNMPEPEKMCPGGLSYQVVLQDARGEVPSVKCPATPTPTVKEIEKKLKV